MCTLTFWPESEFLTKAKHMEKKFYLIYTGCHKKSRTLFSEVTFMNYMDFN